MGSSRDGCATQQVQVRLLEVTATSQPQPCSSKAIRFANASRDRSFPQPPQRGSSSRPLFMASACISVCGADVCTARAAWWPCRCPVGSQGSVCDRIHPRETWSYGEGGSRRSGNRYEAKRVVIECRTKETDSTVTWATDRLRLYQTLGLQMQQTTLVGDVDVSWISSQLWPAPGMTPFFPRRHFKHQSNRGILHLDRGLVAVLPAESARD